LRSGFLNNIKCLIILNHSLKLNLKVCAFIILLRNIYQANTLPNEINITGERFEKKNIFLLQLKIKILITKYVYEKWIWLFRIPFKFQRDNCENLCSLFY